MLIVDRIKHRNFNEGLQIDVKNHGTARDGTFLSQSLIGVNPTQARIHTARWCSCPESCSAEAENQRQWE